VMETAPNPLVLIVEDDPWSRSISSELLADERFAIASAGDGETGLSLAERLHPAAIVLDLGLPRMTGSEFLRRLRGRASLVTTPVIVVSGQPAELSQEATALADGFLQKPVDLSQLMHQLKAVVATHDGDAIGVGPANSEIALSSLRDRGRLDSTPRVTPASAGRAATCIGTPLR
jgi:DNA-binding response OmpR family regulator